MRLLRGLLALILSYALGVQPALAQVQSIRAAVPGLAGSAAAASGAGALKPLASLQPLAGLARTSPLALPPAPPAFSAASAVRAAAAAPASNPAAAAARVVAIGAAATRSVEDLDRVSGDESSRKASLQFSALQGEALAAAADAESDPSVSKPAATEPSALEKPAAPAAAKTDSVPSALGVFQVYRAPERNRTFWLYAVASSIFQLGFEAYSIAQPYLTSALLTNLLREHKDPRAGDKKALDSLIRSNRSISRIAHWTAQALSYFLIPVFTRDAEKDGPRKWLSRSMWIRSAALVGVVGVFFAPLFVGVKVSMAALFGLVAVQSFFQGVAVTTEGAATNRMQGAKEITPEERNKASAILTGLGGMMALLGPILAGQIARARAVRGKTGVGYALIYGVYAGAIALAGLIYATVKMFGGPSADGKAPDPAPITFKRLLTNLWQGLGLIWKRPFLKTMLVLNTVGSLFSDILTSNVIPDYVDAVAAKDPGALAAVTHMPIVGSILRMQMATSLGNFALMIFMSSLGSIVAALLMKPLSRLFQRSGAKTEEALAVPFFVVAALEAPLFLLMIHAPTLLGVAALYGLQSLVVAFLGISLGGLYQKNLGKVNEDDVNKILAADSLVGIVAAIISTAIYLWRFNDMAPEKMMTYAAVATGVIAAMRIAAAFLCSTKEERHPLTPPPAAVKPVPVRPAHFRPAAGDRGNSALSARFH